MSDVDVVVSQMLEAYAGLASYRGHGTKVSESSHYPGDSNHHELAFVRPARFLLQPALAQHRRETLEVGRVPTGPVVARA